MAANSAFNTRKSPLNELPATHRKRTQFKWAAASVMISAGLIVGACSGSSGDSQSQRPDRERQEMRNVDQRSGDQGNQQNQGDQGNRPAGEGVANAKSATGEPFEMVPIPCQPEGEHQWYRTDDTFVVDPSNPETMYVNVEYKGLFKSTDGGKTWARKTKGLVVDHRNATTNEPCYTEYPVAVIDPTNPKRILLATSGGGGGTINDPNMRGGGVYESTDGGEHWKQMINGEMNGYVTHALVLDPNDPKTVYYGSAASPASYREADPNKIWVTKGIIYKTVDNGKKWEELPTGFEKYMRLSFIAVDPADSKRITASTVLMSPGNGGPNVLGDNPLGVIQSTDGGASWNRVDNLPKGYENALATAASTTNGNNFFQIAAVNGGEKSKSFFSTDGAKTWTESSKNMDVVKYDPFDPSGNRLVGHRWQCTDGPCDMALFESNDAGATWSTFGTLPAEITNIMDHKSRIQNIVFHPSDPNTIFMTGANGYVWKSTDRAATWTKLLSVDMLP